MATKALARELKSAAKALKAKKVLVGFDGTVDKIVAVVDKRFGAGERYRAIPTIAALGKRIVAASGKSTNLELFLKRQKVGGNAAIMAAALAQTSAPVTLVATLGAPKIAPVFGELATKAKLISLGEPTETHALEFGDGKIMLGYTRNLEGITYPRLLKAVGGQEALTKLLAQSSLLAFVNWTMTPGMTTLLKKLASLSLPNRIKDPIYFFDLADPEKRPVEELREVLLILKRFEKHTSGRVVLGLNFKEAQQACVALGLRAQKADEKGLKAMSRALRQELKLYAVAIHPTQSAVVATPEGEFWVRGPFIKTPKLTTGAGDHFNAGLCLGFLMGASPMAAVTLGVAFSGAYVANGQSPTLESALGLIKRGW